METEKQVISSTHVSAGTVWISVAKDLQEARHGLQAAHDGRVEPVVHVRDRDHDADEQAFPVRP